MSQFSYISEEIKMVYPSCAGYMNVQAPEETRDRTRLQLHQLCYSILTQRNLKLTYKQMFIHK